jgi:hypothetical protein
MEDGELGSLDPLSSMLGPRYSTVTDLARFLG